MTNSRRHRRNKNDSLRDMVRLVIAIALIVIAVLMVFFVYSFLNSGNGFEKIKLGKSETEAAAEQRSETIAQGFSRLEDGSWVYYVDDTGTRYQDGWLEHNGSLYYFEDDGIMRTEDLFSQGMKFSFVSYGDKEGALERIIYTGRSEGFEDDSAYPSLVEGNGFKAFLNKEKQVGNFYPISYRRDSDTISHTLGGTANQQVSGPYSLQTDGSYIYYLPLTNQPTGREKTFNGNLYRMRPTDENREIIAEGVQGYLVYQGTVYYYANGSLKSAVEGTTESSAPVFTEDMEYKTVLKEDGKLYLQTVDDVPVTMESDAFRVGDFSYALSEEGEILSVAERVQSELGSYNYIVETSLAFDYPVSRIVRVDKNGKKEVISTEFVGRVSNIHCDGSRFFAEFTDRNGSHAVIKITKDGDVDYSIDDFDGTMKIYAFDDDHVIVSVKDEDGSSFRKVSKDSMIPLAAAVEPAEILPDPENAEYESSSEADETRSSEKKNGQSDALKIDNNGFPLETRSGPGSGQKISDYPEGYGPGSPGTFEVTGPGA